MEAKVIGRHNVADDKICHGQPTFRGTRVLVADVLGQIAEGMAWETIVENTLVRFEVKEAPSGDRAGAAVQVKPAYDDEQPDVTDFDEEGM